MKYINIKYCLLAVLSLLIATSCQDDINLDMDQSHANINGTYGLVRNASGAEPLANITTFGTGTGLAKVYYELSKPAEADLKIQFTLDQVALDDYNKTHGTSYKMYPAQNVTFSNAGVASIATGSKKTEEVTITLTSNGEIGENYALPVMVKLDGVEGYKNSEGSYYIYLVNQMNAIPDANKGTGLINVAYIEVNDESLLNVGEFTIEGTNKPFFDVVHIFAANINIDPKTKRAYLNCNQNVEFVLKNADRLIRPLQAKGIKVCLSILGNWDEAGMASLSDESAADFAAELKHYVDIYGLDGIDFDDEWSKYEENPSSGFVTPSSQAYARLVYETRKAMPDKFISVYEVGRYLPTGEVEGVPVVDLYDYSYNPYYGSWWDNSMMNTSKEKFGPYPVDMSVSLANLDRVKAVRDGGYGVMVFYNYKKSKSLDYVKNLSDVSKILFDKDIQWSGLVYNKKDFTGTNIKRDYNDYLGTYEMTPSQGLFWYEAGPWWDWTDRVKYTLRVEENVAGSSFKVYGWGKNNDDMPFVMDYNALSGLATIALPQQVVDSEGVAWTYSARTSYSLGKGTTVTPYFENAFKGSIDNTGLFTISSSYAEFKSMAALQLAENGSVADIKGGRLQDVAYAPFNLKK